MQTILFISLGAVVGANLRYAVAQASARVTDSTFPYGTLVANLTASFIIGFFLIWVSERVLVDPRWRLLVAVGFCGSYSTFSSYAFETLALAERGQWASAAANVLGMNIACFVAVILGAALARSL